MQLTDEQLRDGWKPHDGGPCPVSGPCEIMQRGGHTAFVKQPEHEDWAHDGNALDIIAYKEQSNG